MPDSEGSPTADDLLDELRRVGELVDGTPSTADVNEHGEWSHHPYYRTFEDWETALRKAGYEPNPQQSNQSLRVSEEELLTHLRDLATELGYPPSSRQMVAFGDYGVSTYETKFGSWNDALRVAGLEPRYPPVEER